VEGKVEPKSVNPGEGEVRVDPRRTEGLVKRETAKGMTSKLREAARVGSFADFSVGWLEAEELLQRLERVGTDVIVMMRGDGKQEIDFQACESDKTGEVCELDDTKEELRRKARSRRSEVDLKRRRRERYSLPLDAE
jgi:hypothetical protein